MKNLTLLILGTFLTLTSCGDDKKPIKNSDKETSSATNNYSIASKDLVLTINADFNTNDEIIVFWKDKSIGWFDDKNTIYGGASDIDGHQSIKFNFPRGIIPNDIRIDISNNKEQKDVKINFIKIESGDREAYFFGNELNNYFEGNEYLKITEGNEKVKLSTVGDNYDPFFKTKHPFILELERVLNTTF